LFIFSADNDGKQNQENGGYRTLNSPVGSKNILTVGSLSQLQVSGIESRDVWIVMTGQRSNATVEVSRFSWNKNPFVDGVPGIGGFPTIDFNRSVFYGYIIVITSLEQLEFLNNS
jgi:hypothetical protein